MAWVEVPLDEAAKAKGGKWEEVPLDTAPAPVAHAAPPAPVEPPVEAPEPDRSWGSPKSVSGTMLRHVPQGATFGFGDELGAGLMAASAGGADLVGRGLKAAGLPLEDIPENPIARKPGEGFLDFLARQYRQNRGESRAELEASKAARPKLALASQLAGGLLVPVPGAGAAKGLGLGARMLQGAKTGAKVGALAGLGNSDADLTKGDVGGAAADTALGGAFGGAVGSAIPVAGSALGGVVPWLKKTAEANAFKALTGGGGIANKAQKLGLSAIDDVLGGTEPTLEGELVRTPNQLGRFVLDRGALKLSPEETVMALKLQNAGERRLAADALKQASQTGAFDVAQAAGEQSNALAGLNDVQKLAAGPREAMVAALESTAAKTPRLDFESANALKTAMNAAYKPGVENKASQQSLNDAIRLYRQQLLAQVEREGGPDLASALRSANNNQANLIMAETLAENRATRGAANQSGGLVGALMGSGGAGLGATLGGGPGAALGGLAGYTANALRPYAPAAIARGADAMSKAAQPVQPLLNLLGNKSDAVTVPAAARFLEFLRKKREAMP